MERGGRSAGWCIVGPLPDALLLIGAPLLAMGVGLAIAGTPLTDRQLVLFGHQETAAGMFIGTFIMAHLFLVVFRSHANPTVFQRHPVRFLVVPTVLFATMCFSRWIAVFVSVLATWWDVYHSSMQTFGLGRLYDARRGNDPTVGRRLDRALNLLLYAGPILGGASLMDHVDDFSEFASVGDRFFTAVPAYAGTYSRVLTWGVVGVGLPFLAGYVVAYWRLHRRGYRVSAPKVALLASTGVCSLVTWGFNPLGQAFFIMNFFHSLQYFTLMWAIERPNLTSLFRLEGRRGGTPLTFALFLAIAFGYGWWAEVFAPGSRVGLNVALVVAIMHFWYDGFIWSVRKKQVFA